MKLLVLGDQSRIRFHALSAMEPLISHWKERGDQVTASEAWPEITAEELKNYDVCVNYIDNWEHRGSARAEAEFLRYLGQGGRVLTIHSGIILKGAGEWQRIHGASFAGHQAHGILSFHVTDPLDGCLADVECFSADEEPYEYAEEASVPKRRFLEYEKNGIRYPAGWECLLKKGKLLYICPGHDAKVWSCAAAVKLCDGCLDYLMRNV